MSNELTPAQRAAKAIATSVECLTTIYKGKPPAESVQRLINEKGAEIIEAEYSAEQRIVEAARAFVEAEEKLGEIKISGETSREGGAIIEAVDTAIALRKAVKEARGETAS